MEIVSCYKAAQIARVSKQAIQNLKILNASGKKKYSFFKYNKATNDMGVDLNDREWTTYVNKTVNTRTSVSKEIEPVIDMESGIVQGEHGNNAPKDDRFEKLTEAVFFVIKKTYNPSAVELEKLTNDISNRFEGKV